MVQVPTQGTPVTHLLQQNDSVTVPSDEVWRVTLVYSTSSGSDIDINNVTIDTANAASGNSVVLAPNDTIEVVSGDDSSNLFISGYDVSGVVDNTPVSEQIQTGDSAVTVPTGETWDVTMLYTTDSGSSIKINGENIDDGDTNSGSSLVLDAGDSINITPGDINTNLHVSGFKVRE